MTHSSDSILQALVNSATEFQLGVVGSPSNTTEIVIDILQQHEDKRILGQLVYLVIPQDGTRLAVLGQVSKLETKNRWHEDMTFRGVVKRTGGIPHLSGKADVRTATISIQATFQFSPGDQEYVTDGVLAVSPSTGTMVYKVRDEVLDKLLSQHRNEVVYLGRAYSTDVRMPLWLKHFGAGNAGAGEAYHIGVFGKTGSGKSGLAAYLLLSYARHKNMGLLWIDPQGQFTAGKKLPFVPMEKLQSIGRTVKSYRLTEQVRLPDNRHDLFAELLGKYDFYRKIGVRLGNNQDYAKEEISNVLKRVLDSRGCKLSNPVTDGLLREVFENLHKDDKALQRIYSGSDALKRLRSNLQELIDDEHALKELEEDTWFPVLDLFLETDTKGRPRTSLNGIVSSLTETNGSQERPIIFLDISGEGDVETQALFLKEITDSLRWQGEKAFKEGREVNCLVVLDEAHRFASRVYGDNDSERAELTAKFVKNVRETRKYGLGFMFITQTIASLHTEILDQLRVKYIGFGLNMGQELVKLKEIIGSDSQALGLYTSFTDPHSGSNKQYPFMVTGPASPLSFTGAPLFFQTFTDFEKEFIPANPFFRRG